MARIPDQDIERLKQTVSVVRLVEAAGIALAPHGQDRVGRCPFHDDRTPSLVISPESNLWHCLGACQSGGSVIDWVMRFHKVSFRHACEMLRSDHPALASPVNPDTSSAAMQARLDSAVKPLPQSKLRQEVNPFALDAGDQALLDQVIGFYHDALKQSPEALAYLEQRGLHDPALIERFRIGYANRTLAYRIPPKHAKAGAEMRGALQRIGLLRDSGHEHFNGSLVIPILDAEGHATEVYGRKIRDDLRPGTPLHLYLPGPHRGVFNRGGIEGQEEVILCEALIDALTFIAAGYPNVSTAYGVSGFTDEILQALKSCGAQRILIAYDRDAAGDGAAVKLAASLQAEGLACFRLRFPKGLDANAYALSVKPARKSLGVVIRSAEWIGSGAAPVRAHCIEPAVIELPAPQPPPDPAPSPASSLAADAGAFCVEPGDTAPPLPARAVGAALEAEPAADITEHDVVMRFGERRYRVRGLSKNTSHEVLKVNVLVSWSSNEERGMSNGLHVDTFDLYQAKARQVFARQAAGELGCEDAVVNRDLGQLLLKLEGLQDAAIRATLAPKHPGPAAMAQAEEQAALAFLKSPDLIERIAADFERIGLVGEPVNALVGYLAAVSRKLAGPLAIIIQSTSAAGKSAVMDAVLKLVPDEDRVQYSAMTGQSLFYLGEKDLKHKILAIAEEEGVRQAAYALKLLQSQGELTIASTGKDPETGKLVTEEYRVEGPVMLFLTTTAIDLDEELLNRCLVLTIDESREQTRAIQARQRAARTLAGLRAQTESECLTTLHRNAQRLLKPLAVVNPFAEALTFLDERTRTRRDHQKYLTLIDAIALLHQHQRPVRTLRVPSGNGSLESGEHAKTIEYVEVTAADIALANTLAHEVLGRSLDELPPQTRRLLGLIHAMVTARAQHQRVKPGEVRFTRREIREHTGLGQTQLTIHLQRLEAMEYLLRPLGHRGQMLLYELAYQGEGQGGERFLLKLIEPETLHCDPPLSGDRHDLSALNRPQTGAESGADRTAPEGSKASSGKASCDGIVQQAKNPHPGPRGGGGGRSASAALSSLAAGVEAA
jgi:DNA primase catalytic core